MKAACGVHVKSIVGLGQTLKICIHEGKRLELSSNPQDGQPLGFFIGTGTNLAMGFNCESHQVVVSLSCTTTVTV